MEGVSERAKGLSVLSKIAQYSLVSDPTEDRVLPGHKKYLEAGAQLHTCTARLLVLLLMVAPPPPVKARRYV
jgi:hypothetical protein